MIWDGIDQRRFPRAVHRCHLVLSKDGREERIETQTENIGAGGVCVTIDRAFNIFESVLLELFLEQDQPPIKCHGTIVWVVRRHHIRGEKPIEFDTGIEFEDIADEDRKRMADFVDKLLGSKS